MKPPTADKVKNKGNDKKVYRLKTPAVCFFPLADLNPQPWRVNICLSTCCRVCLTVPQVFVMSHSHPNDWFYCVLFCDDNVGVRLYQPACKICSEADKSLLKLMISPCLELFIYLAESPLHLPRLCAIRYIYLCHHGVFFSFPTSKHGSSGFLLEMKPLVERKDVD